MREMKKTSFQPSHRLAGAFLHLRDDCGVSVAGTNVTVRQVRHEFLFGSNIFGLNVADPLPAQKDYQDRFAALLNYATLPFYWGSYEKTPDQPDEKRLQEMALWCREHEIIPKGHPLCWHEVPPKWHADKTFDEMYRRQMDRITREVGRFKGLIDTWDVVNEAVIMPTFTRTPNPVTPLAQRLGVVPLIREAFERARAANSEAVLLLNDYNHTVAYEQLIEQCLDASVTIDVIGIQSHMHRGYLGRETILDICNRFSRFKKPLHWTEATLLSGELLAKNDFHTVRKDWLSTPEGEARQAEEVVDFYTTLYSHPAVQGITWWDFMDGCWLGAPAGLVRKDMSPKPAYERLMKLIKGTWWFGEQVLRTDSTGGIRLFAPPGDYLVSAAGKKASFVHNRTGTHELMLG